MANFQDVKRWTAIVGEDRPMLSVEIHSNSSTGFRQDFVQTLDLMRGLPMRRLVISSALSWHQFIND